MWLSFSNQCGVGEKNQNVRFFCLFCFLTKRPWQVSTPSLTKGVLGVGVLYFVMNWKGWVDQQLMSRCREDFPQIESRLKHRVCC